MSSSTTQTNPPTTFFAFNENNEPYVLSFNQETTHDGKGISDIFTHKVEPLLEQTYSKNGNVPLTNVKVVRLSEQINNEYMWQKANLNDPLTKNISMYYGKEEYIDLVGKCVAGFLLGCLIGIFFLYVYK